MIAFITSILDLLREYIPLLSNLAVVLTTVLLLQKSLKKHASTYYTIFGIISICVLLIMFNVVGISRQEIRGIPVVIQIYRMFTHMSGFSFPLLIIIMYMGALDTRKKWVAKLMSIRSELSILAGFPVMLHAILRITHITPSNLRFVFQGERVGSFHGESISYTAELLQQSAYFLGIFMSILFLILWVTSFPPIRKSLGGKRWKQVQRWSYLLYAMIFCHSTLLNSSWLLSYIDQGRPLYSRIIALTTTTLIFGSYLILRVRKARKDRQKWLARSSR